MARAEAKTPDRLEIYAETVERRVNDELAKLGPMPPTAFPGDDPESDAIIDRIVPSDWDWSDATVIGGPRQIVITQYARNSR